MQNLDQLCMGCMNQKNGEQVCAVCGFDDTAYVEPNALPLRTLLAGRYVVGKAVSTGGEGFTYLGLDTVTEAAVKITEYFPTGVCDRQSDGTVLVHPEANYTFNEGLLLFMEQNKKLGLLSNVSALYRVIDIFETNKTAYCISEYVSGISLKEFLLRNGGTLTWEQVRPLFLPLLTALRTLHQNDLVHGGISPETLMVGRDGKVRIDAFTISAIRNAKSEMTAQLYPGFTAIEQYRGEKLTPATDVYGFAATMYRALTGNSPLDAKQRLEQDNMSFPKSVAEQMPRSVLVAMANALQIEPEDRTATMDEMLDDLQTTETAVATADSDKSSASRVQKKASRKYTFFAAVATFLILALIAGIVYLAAFRKGEQGDASSIVSMPSTVSVGDIGNSSSPEPLFSVPDFSGHSVAELMSNDEYSKWFIFKVARKEYNSKVEKGKICAQSVAAGTSAKKETEIELTVSLGPSAFLVPRKLKGMTKQEAYITLLELGLEPSNIEFIEKMGETPSLEEEIIETNPAIGEKITPDSTIILYYNINIVVPQTESQNEMENNME